MSGTVFLAPVRPRAEGASAGGLVVADGRVRELLAPGAPAPAGCAIAPLPPGAVLFPAFADSHLHLAALGRQGRELRLHGLSYEACLRLVKARAAELPDDGWITGHGWDQNLWNLPQSESRGGWPLAAALDGAAGGRPVSLKRIDGHAAWVSRAALARARISAETPDPPGGTIVRDRAGTPSGVLIDLAMAPVSAALPKRTVESIRGDLLDGRARMLAHGALRLHDMDIDDATAAAYLDLARAGALRARVTAYAGAESALARELLRTGPQRHGDSLRFAGIKLYADGALGSRGARLLCPYHDDPASCGLSLWTDADLAKLLRGCADAGLQVAAHAIGDGACRQLLDHFEAFGGAPKQLRWRIEHAQIVDPADVERIARLGLTASIQPGHAVGDAPWAEARLGRERLAGAYAYRALRDAGVPLALGSDAPIDDERPLWQFHCAVKRCGFDGKPPGGFLPEQALSAGEALIALGETPAALTGDPGGLLAPGQPADFVALSADIAADPAAAARCEVLGIWREGVAVASRE